MKVHLIRKETVENFTIANSRAKSSFDAWLKTIKHADWHSPLDIQETFGNVDLLGSGINRAIFNVGGNNYRVICKYAFGEKKVHLFICWIGTHTEYSELCKRNDQYTVNDF